MSKKDTVCQTCVFRNGTNGCFFGIIDNAKAAGLEVVECWNEQGEFNVIAGAQCMYHRTKGWKKKKSVDKTSSLAKLAASEIAIRFTAIIVCDDTSTLDDIKSSIDSLAEQKHRPDYVIIVREWRNKVEPKDLIGYMKDKKFNEWKIESLVDAARIGRKAVEPVLRFKARPYFATFRAGRTIHKDFFDILNRKITKEFFVFTIINNGIDDIDGVVVPNVIYQYFSNSFFKLEEYIEKEDEKCPGILNIQTVDPTFQ